MTPPAKPPEDEERAIQEAEAILPPIDPQALEHWLRTEVVAAYDELKANPSSAIPVEEVRARIEARRRASLDPSS